MSLRRHNAIEELLERLDLIEEQARLAIAEFPAQIRKERQRRILELVQEIRAAADPSRALAADPAPASS